MDPPSTPSEVLPKDTIHVAGAQPIDAIQAIGTKNINATQAAVTPSSVENPSLSPNNKVELSEKVASSHRKKSRDWDHFEKIEDKQGQSRIVCNYCKKEYLVESSNLLSHLVNCPKYPYKELPKKQKTLSFEPTQGGEEGLNLVATSFTLEAGRKALTEMIIIDGLPFKFVEKYGFRRFCNVLQPEFYNIPSHLTVARDVVNIYFAEREKLREALRGRRVCLTTDTWTSIQNINYLCLTCHFIDDDWKLNKRILNFCLVDDQKEETIGRKIETCLLEWNIDSIFTSTVDNANSDSTTVQFLKRVTKDWKGTVLGHEFLHMRCCAHIVNLVVGDALKELDVSVARVRDAVRYVKSSPNRFQAFKNYAVKLNIESMNLLCLDVPTRWDSTYQMLENAEKFKKAFERLEDEDSNYRVYFMDKDECRNSGTLCGGPPNEEDWKNCKSLVKFLKLFYDATKRFSGSMYVTSNAFFDDIFVIQTNFDQLIRSDDYIFSSMARNMKRKFERYWGNRNKINLLLYVAVALDPRKKLTYLQFCFSEIYNDVVVNGMLDEVKDALTRLYEHHASTDSPSVQVESEDETSLIQVHENYDDPCKLIASRYRRFLEERQSIGCKNEVDKFLAENCEGTDDEKFDILSWWKNNSSRYRILSQVARDVLAVPFSTVVYESAFSTGGRILDPFCSSLSPKMIQALICTQNWLQASVPISLRKAMDDVEQFEEYDLAYLDSESGSSSSTITDLYA